MIKDLKFALTCMKYAHNKKMLSAISILFVVLGSINLYFGQGTSYVMSGYLLTAAPMMLGQMFQTMNMSKLVLASPKRPAMENRILAVLNGACAVAGFIIFTIAMVVLYCTGRCSADLIAYCYVIEGLFTFVLLVYMAFSYKFYIVSSAIFMVVFLIVYAGSIYFYNNYLPTMSITIYFGVGVAAACIILGCLAFNAVSKLVYKKPMDKFAMQSVIKGEI